MTQAQKIIKYFALVLASLLIVSIIGGIVSAVSGIGFISGLFGGDSSIGEMRDLGVDTAADILQLELRAVSLTVQTGDAFSVQTNDTRITCESDGDTLRIQEKARGWFEDGEAGKVIITLPAEHIFTKVDIDAGAGKMDIAQVHTGIFSLNIGAGDVQIGTLQVTDDTAINGGAGQIIIDSGVLADFDLDMGVGQFDCTAALTGDSEINCGVGEVRLTLIGTAADYRIELDKGIGSATVDGKALSDGETYGTGANEIDIDGGVGAIKVDFEEK